MSYQYLEIDLRGRAAHVWMNRPERHNAFDEALIGELTEVFQRLGRDQRVRVVVLGGRGKSFSAGADLEWMRRAAAYTVEENLRDARAMARLFETIHRLPKPTVARVQGAALGGGAGLTATCDIAIASTQASFATTEVRFGIIPGAISPYVIAAIGPRSASRYFLSAERFDAAEACRIGLVHEVCAPESLDQRVDAIVAALLSGGPSAQAAVKKLIRDVAHRPVDEALIEATAKRIATVRATAEAREGIGAFLEKRQAAWLAAS
jgi:methylglutaconyl-CoA hydratase